MPDQMRTAFEYVVSDDASLTGWYIVEYDSTGQSYDAVGPYDSEEEAREVYEECKDVE